MQEVSGSMDSEEVAAAAAPGEEPMSGRWTLSRCISVGVLICRAHDAAMGTEQKATAAPPGKEAQLLGVLSDGAVACTFLRQSYVTVPWLLLFCVNPICTF